MLSAVPLSVGDLLNRRHPFVVPPYQRGYAWEDDELTDFISDIRKLVEERRFNPQKRHFFGGVFTVGREDVGAGPGRRLQLIDGQQRLATFTLLLAIIGQEFQRLGEEARKLGLEEIAENALDLARNTREHFVETEEYDPYGRKTKSIRLTLSKADDPHFVSLVKGELPEPRRASHRRLSRAWQRLRTELVEKFLVNNGTTLPPDVRLQRLLELRSTLTDGCYILHISSQSVSEAHQLFMVINDRGRNLGAGDLLRAWTLEQTEGYPDQQREMEKLWDNILADEEAHIDHFLRTRYTSHLGRRPGRNSLFDDFCKAFFNSQGDNVGERFLSEIRQIAEEAALFRQLVAGDWVYESGGSSVKQWYKNRLRLLVAPNALNHELSLPLLMAARARLSESVFAELVHVLEKAYFRYKIICRGHTGPLTNAYHDEILRIRRGEEPYSLEPFKVKLRELLRERAPEATFRNEAVQVLQYDPSGPNRGVLKYFLTTLAHYCVWDTQTQSWRISLDDTYVLDLDSLHIEHIYPQHAQHVVPELEPLKHSLGNLTFWREKDNRAAANADFQTKRTYYAQSHRLNQRLALFSEWNASTVQQWSKELIECALRVYDV